ncbi:uroporphyrinogen-III methyltransferase [Klebsiella michiganensis]|uniref:Uroporphyrinogen-III methyltransferase n=1 Tax=Klebsiella michiganensis TaxID=1134687 RepID=A0A7H4PE14_9ENTR|nr:uroporphyrinogen-III methyltransferase [Klebsiella michiganensis]
MSQVDYDGIILKVNQLANQIDNLRLADNNDDDTPMDSDSDELSSSISEWRVNLQKSWQNFMDSFITVRRRDETAVPLLAPKPGRLSAPKTSAPVCWSRRRRFRVIRKKPTNRRWITSRRGFRAYYDTEDATTKAFLEDVDKLSQQSITMKRTGEPCRARRCLRN